MERLFENRKQMIFWIAATAALLLLGYGWSLHNGFVTWDDGLLIYENPIIRGLTWGHIKQAFSQYDPELYIPLTYLSFQINFALGGLNSFGYHLGNLLLHFFTSLLVGYTVFAIDKRKAPAIIAMLLFAVHPIQVETVAWAAARKDALAWPFFMLSVLCYLKREASPKAWLWIVFSLLSFTVGLLAKVVVITLPAALILIDWYRGKLPPLHSPSPNQGEGLGRGQSVVRKPPPTLLKYGLMLAPYFAIAIIFFIIANTGKVTNQAFYLEKLYMGSLSVLLHLWHIIFPWGFSTAYPYTQPLSIFTPDIFASVVLTVGLLVGTWILRRWTRLPFFAFVWFLLLMAPSMTNIAKGHNELLDVYITSDRYAYVSVMSIFMAFGIGIEMALEHFSVWKKPLIGALTLIVAILTLLTIHLSLTWKNTLTLFTHTLKHYPNAYVAYVNIGTEAYKEGQVEKALAYYNKALEVRADSTSFYNIGVIMLREKRYQEAEAMFLKSIEAVPIDPDPRIALTTMYIEQERWNEAEKVLRAGIEEAKPSTHIYGLLGFVLEKKGMTQEAIAMYRKSLELNPENRDALEGLRALGIDPRLLPE